MLALPGEAPSARRFTKAQNLPRNTHTHTQGEKKTKIRVFYQAQIKYIFMLLHL